MSDNPSASHVATSDGIRVTKAYTSNFEWKRETLISNGLHTYATSDLTIHFLSPVALGPARADAWIVRQGRSNFVLQVEVTDVGRDNKLAAISTIAFTVLAPQP